MSKLGYPHELQYWNCCKPPKKGYAGTAILVSKEYGGEEPMSVKYDMNIMKHDGEGRVVTLEFPKYFLVSVYVPNAGRSLDYRVNEWDVDF